MNTIDQYIAIAALIGLIAGCALGFYSGRNSGIITGWERCRWQMGMRQAAAERARRDARGRFRRVLKLGNYVERELNMEGDK